MGIALTIIRLSVTCKTCHAPLLKNPNCLGDYNEDGILQAWCPECGTMTPAVQVTFVNNDDNYLSNNTKRRLAVRIAKKYGLDYKAVNDIVKKYRNIEDRNEFVRLLTSEVKTMFNVQARAVRDDLVV